MTGRPDTSRVGLLVRRPFASIVVSFMVVSCVQTEKTVPSASPTAGISPIAAPASSATATPPTFPDLPVLIATGADLQRYRGGKWELVARVCPGETNTGKAIAALRVASDGTRALVVCWQSPPGVNDARFARETYMVDLASGAIKALAPVGNGVGALSPDGTQLIVGAYASPSAAATLRTHWSIRDLASGQEKEILPDGLHFMHEWRWTVLGPLYFQAICFGGGCTSPERAGTFLWTGSGWRKLTDARVIDAAIDGSALLEFGDPGSSLFAETRVGVLIGGVERILTPPSVRYEHAVARFGDGRVAAWRLGTRGQIRGLIVVYAPDGTSSPVEGDMGYYCCSAHNDRWLVGTDGNTLYAFDLSTGLFASLRSGRSIDALVVLPR